VNTFWIVLLKPFFLLFLMAVFVLPIELLLRRFWPEGSMKRILFDKSFRDRKPVTFGIVLTGLWFSMIGGVYLLYVNT
jgi:hypothetical protein